jgi:hypothetical protein
MPGVEVAAPILAAAKAFTIPILIAIEQKAFHTLAGHHLAELNGAHGHAMRS